MRIYNEDKPVYKSPFTSADTKLINQYIYDKIRWLEHLGSEVNMNGSYWIEEDYRLPCRFSINQDVGAKLKRIKGNWTIDIHPIFWVKATVRQKKAAIHACICEYVMRIAHREEIVTTGVFSSQWYLYMRTLKTGSYFICPQNSWSVDLCKI